MGRWLKVPNIENLGIEAIWKGDQKVNGLAHGCQVLYAFKSRQLVAQGKKGGTHLKVDKNLINAAKEYEEVIPLV